MPNRGPGGDSFLSLYNPGLWSLIRKGNFDAVLCYLSYRCASFWIAFFASRLSRTAFLFGTDASSLAPRSGASWKLTFKKAFWPWLYSLADQVLAPSRATRDLMLSLRVPRDRITLTPYSVDNDWWIAQSQSADRHTTRTSWGARSDTCVVLFCAKLQPWKRPQDLLQAFALAKPSDALLVFAGDGPQRDQLETQASQLGIRGSVRFLGFQNQTQLPAIYSAADLLVLPSEYEPFGVVVNEASCCGCPVVASDRVGAARDLVLPAAPELVYPCGNVEALAAILAKLCSNRELLARLGLSFKQRMATWSPEHSVAGSVDAVAKAVARRHR